MKNHKNLLLCSIVNLRNRPNFLTLAKQSSFITFTSHLKVVKYFLASMCPPIERVENANATLLNGGGRNYGTVINFECEPGYVMAGIPTVLCQSNGTWSAGVPQCSRKYI